MSTKDYIDEIATQSDNIDTSGAIFRDRVFTMGEVLAMLSDGKLQFISAKPAGKWTKNRSNNAIESLLMGMPPTQLIIDGSAPTWFVLEGDAFFKACHRFYTGRSRLENSILCEDAAFGELPRRLRERFVNFKVTASVISPGCSMADRLWAYRTTLLRQNLASRVSLIDCIKAVNSEFAEKARWVCDRCEINDVELLLNIVIGYGLAEYIANATTYISRRLENVPYDIYSSLLLNRIPSLLADDRTADITRIISNVSKNFIDATIPNSGDISRESRICFTIALGAIFSREIKAAHDFSLENIRIDAIDRTVGNYLKKASEIYHNII